MKKTIFIVLALLSSLAHAQCDDVFKGMDKTSMKMLYNDCLNMEKDLRQIEKSGGKKLDTLQLNSDDGFLQAFKKIAQRGLGSDDYSTISAEYTHLKKQYSNYFKTDRVKNIQALSTLTSRQLQPFKNQYILGSQNNDIEISETVKFLDVVMESDKVLKEYKKANEQIPPILVNVFGQDNYTQYKNKKFNYYECRYIELILPENNVQALKDKINYSCEISTSGIKQ